jgi:hypothetical protein
VFLQLLSLGSVDVLVLLAEVTQAREEAASTNAARMVATLDAEALPRRLL